MSSPRQLITFQLGDQVLGADIIAIREIRAWSAATPLPNVPDYVQGMINLRGIVLPVIDLRRRLGLGRTEPSERHAVIVILIGEQLLGLIVDAVNDIVTVRPEDMQPPPNLGDSAAGFLDGIATIDDRMILMICLDRLMEDVIPSCQAA